MLKRVRFLGYDRLHTKLIDSIASFGWEVSWTDQRVHDLATWDAVVSFGYRHILTRDVLQTAKRPVINLHIAYLPWNRGAHPVFWAAYDGTPSGVTIHEIDTGVDTGPICFQRRIELDYEAETFESAYTKHIASIETLFKEHALELLNGEYSTTPQQGPGTFKRSRDLPSGFSWSEPIAPTIRRLRRSECTSGSLQQD